jgi:hypothetical protein
MLQVQWFPPSGLTTIDFDSSPYSLVDVVGLADVLASPVIQKSSGQIGTTVSSTTVSERVITLTVDIFTASQSDLWAARQALSAALVFSPPASGVLPTLGTLRFTRDGYPPLDILAMPKDATPDIIFSQETYGIATIEFYCPYPFFKDIADSSQLLQGTGGMQFGVQFPLEVTSYNVTTTINNMGTVPAPILCRIFGDCTTPRITNVTTGEFIEIAGHIVAGTYLEVNTAYGQKSVTLVDGSGNRSNAMGGLNLSSTFWKLPVGVSTVSFTAGTNISGYAQLFWRQRYTGI